MNTSQPVSSDLANVRFTHLTSADIHALSALRITNATTLDPLLNPTTHGLYSPSLGQFGTEPCATCGLKTPQCPGHCGHIQLPVPVYHPLYLDHVLRLLRGMCEYCWRLRMNRKGVSRVVAKLRLLAAGLVKEARDVDQITLQVAVKGGKQSTRHNDDDDDDDSEDSEAGGSTEEIETFVRESLAQARLEGNIASQKTETAINARRAVLIDFMKDIAASKKCKNCQGINHRFRKDRFVKIFRKGLSEKERLAMIQSGHKAKDPVLEMQKKAEAEKVAESKKRKREEADEGVADMEQSSDEEPEGDTEGEDVESEDGEEPEIAGGNILDDTAETSTSAGKKKSAPPVEEYINPARVHAQLAALFEKEQEVLSLVYGGSVPLQSRLKSRKAANNVSADMFFVRDVLVPPNRYRPEARTGENEIAEAPENTLYKNILNSMQVMSDVQRELSGQPVERASSTLRVRLRTYADFETAWVQLQDNVNSLMDRGLNPLQGAAGRRAADGIKQKLEKKEGMFRKYMMGKRVNFAARTVISPDPNIETNEIGVPPVFAKKLTYPEPVTQWNVEDLQECVRNGPFKWPGAVAIESENGQIVSLERKNGEERMALANQLLAPSITTSGFGSRGTRNKKVHRHLNNGDIVIMNRQPTLHKPSMMCHRARVLQGEKTLRMHYANCKTYNADFDGDEMNLHFPQNEVARAEALSIADTDHQYLSGTAGEPLRGLIQDHISMCLALTCRDCFFERGEYMQLLYAALRPESGHCASGRIETLSPALLKPRMLWTGKQVVSSVLLNVTPKTHQGLTMSGKSSTDAKMWGLEGKEEGEVVIQDGYLCQGVLDKKQIGPSSGGFVNAAYEAYGHVVAGRLLSVLGRLLTRLLQVRGFSCGVADLIYTKEGEIKRREALAGAEGVGLQVAAKYVSLQSEKPRAEDRELRRRLEDVLRDDAKQANLDQLTNSATKDISYAASSACLPAALVKPFPSNQMQSMTVSGAKGTTVNANQISSNLGQQVLEGRRVPVMASGKTLPCFRPFETSVRAGGYIVDRFLTGVRPQEYFFHAMAGREGLIDTAVKTSRSGYLQRCLIKGMEGLRVEYDSTVRDLSDGSLVQFLYGEDGLDVAKAKYLPDFKFAAQNHLSLFQSFDMRDEFGRIVSEEARAWNKSAEKTYRKTADLGSSEPALAKFPPATHAGSTSEKMYRASRDYAETNPDRLIRDKKKDIEGTAALSKKTFHSILDVRYLKSVVEAGEAVGVVAGQSVGEPSTQMTLNTFHLAGHAAKNVTLGIPRLRELLMTAAADIATPSMTLTMNEEITLADAKKFTKGIARLCLAEVIDKANVTERIGNGTAYAQARMFDVRLELFKKEEYMKEYAITVDDVISTIEHRFLPRFQTMIRKEMRKRKSEGTGKVARDGIGKSAGPVEQETSRPEAERAGGDDDSDGEGDDDATRDKAKSNRAQAGYEAMEDEEEHAVRERQTREAEPAEMEDEGFGGSPRGTPEPAQSQEEDEEADEEVRARRSAAKDREERIKGNRGTSDVTAFSFDDAMGDVCAFTIEYDADTPKILMLRLVEQAARDALIQSVPGITSAVVEEAAPPSSKAPSEPKTPPVTAVTAGVNLPAMWEQQHIIHPHKLTSNSVAAMLRHYGVEAARATLITELGGVFAGHGIAVDPRHLMLIADYMTRDGAYQAFSRAGYRGNASAFMRMSFETTVGVLKESVLEGEVEALRGPSAKIVVGKVGGMGTGGFDVLVPVGGDGGGESDGEGGGMEEGDADVDASDG